MAESLTFNIGADTSGFQTGIGGILTGLAGLAAAFVSVQAIVEGFSQAIEMGGRLHDLSTRTGETAGNLAILERAFENASVGAEKLGPAIAKMQKAMVDMQQGNEEAIAAFKQLGLAWSDLEGKSPSEQLHLIGVRLSAIEDPALRAETAMRIFGRSGAELLPILINFRQETAEAERQLGTLPELLDRNAAAVDQFGDNLNAIGNKMTEFAFGFLSEVMPALNMFTSKLAGFDAASIGAGLAQALVGAFANPMKAAELLGDVLRLGAQIMGNELIFQIRYWKDVLFNTFDTLGSDIFPMLGNILTGQFAIAVGTLGTLIADTLRPVAEFLGLDFIEEMARSSKDLMEQGAAKIAESANQFASALEGAKNSSTVVRQDFTGAEESSAQIKQDFAGLQADAKAAMDELTPVGALAPQSGADISQADIDQIRMRYEADMKVAQDAQNAGKVPTKTPAQIQAEFNRQLGLIGGAAPTQAIGQSASARRAIEATKELDTLIALGKGGTREAEALRESIARNQAIAFAPKLTAGDEQIARDWALDQWMKDTSQSYTDLEEMAKQNILEGKAVDAGVATPEDQKKKLAAMAGGPSSTQAFQAIAQGVLNILQKIEPKLPQHIMS